MVLDAFSQRFASESNQTIVKVLESFERAEASYSLVFSDFGCLCSFPFLALHMFPGRHRIYLQICSV
jgi:hypothetical protein